MKERCTEGYKGVCKGVCKDKKLLEDVTRESGDFFPLGKKVLSSEEEEKEGKEKEGTEEGKGEGGEEGKGGGEGGEEGKGGGGEEGEVKRRSKREQGNDKFSQRTSFLKERGNIKTHIILKSRRCDFTIQ